MKEILQFWERPRADLDPDPGSGLIEMFPEMFRYDSVLYTLYWELFLVWTENNFKAPDHKTAVM